METVPIRIGEFELQIKEYIDYRGTEPTNEEKNSDLSPILLEQLKTMSYGGPPFPAHTFNSGTCQGSGGARLAEQATPAHS